MKFELLLHLDANSGLSAEDSLHVRQQMDKILADNLFSHSKRYPALLRYIVENSLAGKAAFLKERTIGIDVFGRHPDYETSFDPVVRISAAEIRKRLAQYYQQPEHENELRIDLRTGSYIPDFYLPRLAAGSAAAIASNGEDTPPTITTQASVSKRQRRISILWATLLLLLLLFAGASYFVHWYRIKEIQAVWAPMLYGPSPAQILLTGHNPNFQTNLDLLSTHDYQRQGYTLHFSDLQALVPIFAIFQDHHRAFQLHPALTTTFEDLRNGPVILVGAYGNPWTLRVVQSLRYGFGRDDAQNLFWIEDHKNPLSRKWIDDMSQAYSAQNQDYAIAARFTYPETGNSLLIAAGIGETGTRAASEFLTSERNLREVASHVDLKGNFEIVLRTHVISGVSGPPEVVAVETW